MPPTRQAVLETAQRRMREQRLSQRKLARLLGITQGHLSKVLNGKIEGDTRTFAALSDWVASPVAVVEAGLLQAARRAAGGQRDGLELLMHMMHLIADLKESRTRRRTTRRKAART